MRTVPEPNAELLSVEDMHNDVASLTAALERRRAERRIGNEQTNDGLTDATLHSFIRFSFVGRNSRPPQSATRRDKKAEGREKGLWSNNGAELHP